MLSEVSSRHPNLAALAELFGFTAGSCEELVGTEANRQQAAVYDRNDRRDGRPSYDPTHIDQWREQDRSPAPPEHRGAGDRITTDEKGGEGMKATIKNKLIQTGKQSYRTLRKRGAAALLTLAMVLPMLPTSLAAGVGLLRPIQATPANIANDVHVEVEGNMVRDPYNRKLLTGYYELGLRVKTPADKSFRTLALTLEYDAAHFTPVDWSAADAPVDMTTNITEHYQKDMRAWSIGGINDLDAFGGIPAVPDAPIDDPTAPTPQVDPNRAMMTFTVRANKAAELKFDDMTTIAVVRFKVHDDPNYVDPTGQNLPEDFLGHFSLKKNGPGDFSLCYDDDLTDTTAPVVVDTMEALQGKMGANAKPLANAATDDDIDLSASDVNMALDYMLWDDADETKSYEYYYVPGYKYDANDPTTYDQVTTTIGGQSYTLNRPKLKGDVVLAVDPAKPANDPDKYSYVSNLVPNDPVLQTGNPTGWYENINFTMVTKPSAIPGMDQAGQMATIVYLDWDGTIIGEQSAPADGKDLRDVVNDYAAEHLIYHDIDDTVYGPQDLNDPNDPANTDTPLDIVKNLERKYNYRGKYPTTPSPDNTTDGTTVDDKTTVDGNGNLILPLGKTYPLTNKLDYVFLKRPMERKNAQKPDPTDAAYQTPDTNNKTGAEHEDYIRDLADWNTWVQKADTTGANPVAEYDTDNPFAYGWALCTRANYKDVWTTLGVGELGYNGSTTLGGYMELNGVPGEITFDPEGRSYDFALADLEHGITGPVYLKAVYEPGKDIVDSTTNYRSVGEPYYSKLNAGAASAGGAYSVELALERANVPVDGSSNNIFGLARTRAPAIRQDTTTDLRWVAEPTLNVNHNLPNDKNSVAYGGKTATAFTLVEVPNTDLIEFSLTLSARHNKVDYYLRDTDGMNFVAGPPRSDNDSTRSTVQSTLDNYNYLVDGDSDTSDLWNDSSYDDRDGSRGFVLYGTMNKILKMAYDNDPLFNSYTLAGVFQDINLRNANNTFPSGTTQLNAMRAKLIAAAQAAKAAGGAYWDEAHDAPNLTWHQLQNFVINNSLSVSEGPTGNPGWCHLHAACSSAASGKPTDWPTLITAAGTSGTLGGIANLFLSDLEGIGYLRKDASGTPFSTVNEYITALEAAVASLGATPTPSWDAVQAAILNNGDTAADGPNKYWWYDSATTVTSLPTGSWSDLLTLARDAVTAPVIPGETSTTAQKRLAKLNQVEPIYDDNAYVTGADTRWIAVTENLCKDNNGGKFTTFSDFTTALVDALDAYAVTTDPNYTLAPDWFQVQYYILHGSTAAPDGNAAAPAEYANYWWHNGGQKVTDLASLLRAARDANSGNSASLNALTVTDLYNTSYTELFFGKDYKGTRYTAADLSSFKNLVKSYVQAPGCNDTWDQLQYYIIASAAGTCDLTNSATTLDINAKSSYFWWKGNGTGTAVTFNTATKGNVADLLKAAYTSRVTGDSKAWDNLTDTIVKNYRIIKTLDSSTDFNDFPKFAAADLANFKTYMEDLVDALIAAAGQNTLPMPDLPTATWYQVQYAALNSGALVTGSSIPDNATYWWLNNDTNVDPAAEYTTLMNNLFALVKGTMSQNDFKDTITVNLLNTLGFKVGNPPAAPSTANLNTAKTRLANLRTKVQLATVGGLRDAAGNPTTAVANAVSVKLDWYQVQMMLVLNNTNSVSVATTQMNNRSITKPAWAAAAGYSLRPMNAMLMAPKPNNVTTEISPDGLTETTTSTMKIWNEDTQSEDVEIMTVVVTRIPGETTTTIVTTTTVTVTTLDPETLQPVTAVDTYTEVTTEPNAPSSTYDVDNDTNLVGPDDPAGPSTEEDLPEENLPTAGADDVTYSTDKDTNLVAPTVGPDDLGRPNADLNDDVDHDNGGDVGPGDSADDANDGVVVGPDDPADDPTDDPIYTITSDTTPLTTSFVTQKEEIPVANDLKIKYNEENTHTPTVSTAIGLSDSGEGALGDVVPEGGESVVQTSNWEKGISTLAQSLSATRLTAETMGQSITQAQWQELFSTRRVAEREPKVVSPNVTTLVFFDSGQRWGPPPDPGGLSALPNNKLDHLVVSDSLNLAPRRRITHE